MPCPCCGEWPCSRDIAEDEYRREAEEGAQESDHATSRDSYLDSLEATPEGQGWTPMQRESPDDLGDWPDMELGEAEDAAF